jgi:hypothetical protein
MRDHLRNARLYWVALQKGLLLPGSFRLRVDWSAELTLEWARLLGLPGTKPYPVRPRGVACACQPESESSGHPLEVHTLLVLPDGRKVRCQRCGEEWVEKGEARR